LREDKQTIYTTQIDTPIGIMVAGAVEEGICLLEFSNRRTIETQFKSLTKLLQADLSEGKSKHFIQLRLQLKEYFEGKRKVFSLPLVTPGTEFQQMIWNELQKIPYGTTRSYKQQAIAINNLLAIRAVANANGLNRISIIIPCHRIIGEDGSLTGYGGGLWRKKWLLDFEKGQKSLDF
jgi:AraC family transcriptional regulator, regulatory protein of adaptative response / methylated-DNA-[protein]-cysteine methyltransferase